MADDLLRQVGRLDELAQVDASGDAHLLAQEHQVLGAHIAGCALMPCKGATAQTCHAGVEAVHPHLEPRVRVGDTHAAGVVEV